MYPLSSVQALCSCDRSFAQLQQNASALVLMLQPVGDSQASDGQTAAVLQAENTVAGAPVILPPSVPLSKGATWDDTAAVDAYCKILIKLWNNKTLVGDTMEKVPIKGHGEDLISLRDYAPKMTEQGDLEIELARLEKEVAVTKNDLTDNFAWLYATAMFSPRTVIGIDFLMKAFRRVNLFYYNCLFGKGIGADVRMAKAAAKGVLVQRHLRCRLLQHVRFCSR